MIIGMVILECADLTENLNHRSSWVVYHISECKIIYAISDKTNRNRATETEAETHDDVRDRFGLRPDGGKVMNRRRGMLHGELCYSCYITVTKLNCH